MEIVCGVSSPSRGAYWNLEERLFWLLRKTTPFDSGFKGDSNALIVASEEV